MDSSSTRSNTELFKQSFGLSAVSSKALDDISEIFPVEAEEVFVTAGKKNSYEYIVVTGFARSFLHDPDGNDITLSFYKSGYVLPPHLIRTRDNVSIVNLQMLTRGDL